MCHSSLLAADHSTVHIYDWYQRKLSQERRGSVPCEEALCRPLGGEALGVRLKTGPVPALKVPLKEEPLESGERLQGPLPVPGQLSGIRSCRLATLGD